MHIRVGFASRDGQCVDECLLASAAWWIYDIGEDTTLVDHRKGNGNCEMECGRCSEMILQELKDCDLLFACGCESKMAAFLLANGKQIVETRCSIEETLHRIQQNNAQNISLDYYRRIQSLSPEYGRTVSIGS